MVTLFDNLESGNVHKVQMVLRRLDIPFRRVDVAQTRGEPRRREFLLLNPIGKVPTVLLDDGDVLSESDAILYYFAHHTELWPRDARAQTEVLRWMFFEQYSHEPTLSVIRYLTRFVETPEAHADQVQQLMPKARHALDVISDEAGHDGFGQLPDRHYRGNCPT
jgi:glutathione S-transferase